MWQLAEQARQANRSIAGGFTPRIYSLASDPGATQRDLRIVVLSDEPLSQRIEGVFKSRGITLLSARLGATTSFDAAESEFAGLTNELGEIDVLVVTTTSPSRPRGEIPDAASILDQLGTHAAWTRAVQVVSGQQHRRSTVVNVVRREGDTDVGYEVVRDALSVFVELATANPDSSVRAYAACLLNDRAPSLEALVTACLLLHLRDPEGGLAGNQFVISDQWTGCMSKPELVATATTADAAWNEQQILDVLSPLIH